ncbi:MAG: RQC domain-containing protein, partial [Planctomycetota bacterium]
FGKTLVAQMLCGSKNKKLQQWKLNRLSTYGLLSSMKQVDVVDVMDELIGCGLLQQVEVDQRRPTVQLTTLGREVMQSRQALPDACHLKYPVAKKLANAVRHLESADVTAASETNDDASPELQVTAELIDAVSSDAVDVNPVTSDVVDGDAAHVGDVNQAGERGRKAPDVVIESEPADLVTSDLTDMLKRFRRKRSAALGVPPHQVISVATINRIAEQRPTTIERLEGIRGVGEEMVTAFGHDLVELVRCRLAESAESEELPAAQAEVPATRSKITATQRKEPAESSERERRSSDAADSIAAADADAAADYYWTWRLLRDGYTIDQVAEIRRTHRTQVEKEVALAAQNGLAVDEAWK